MGVASYGISSDTGKGLSPGLWGNCPRFDEMHFGPRHCTHVFEDFVTWRTSTNINASVANWTKGWLAFGDDGAVMTEGGETGGSIVFSSDGDNEGVSIRTAGIPFQIDLDQGDLYFECRLKTSTIANDKHGFFVGLIDAATLSATVPIAAAGTLADENFVGFHRLEGDGDYVDTVYKADGVTQVTVKADAKVLVADTYVKLGMRYSKEDQRLYFYADGAKLADSKAIPTADGTDFPNDVRMGVVFALLNATATTPGETEIDWIACAQVKT